MILDMDRNTVTVNGKPLTYATEQEASGQFCKWLSQAIHFGRGKGGAYDVVIEFTGRRIYVQGFDASPVAVREAGRYWTRQELKNFTRNFPAVAG